MSSESLPGGYSKFNPRTTSIGVLTRKATLEQRNTPIPTGVPKTAEPSTEGAWKTQTAILQRPLVEEWRINAFTYGVKERIQNNPILRPNTASAPGGVNRLRNQKRYVLGRTPTAMRNANFQGFGLPVNQNKYQVQNFWKLIDVHGADAVQYGTVRTRRKVVINAANIMTKLNGYLPTVKQVNFATNFLPATKDKLEGSMEEYKTTTKKVSNPQRKKKHKKEEDIPSLDVSGIDNVVKPDDESFCAVAQLLDGYKKARK